MSFLKQQDDVSQFMMTFKQWNGKDLLSHPQPKDEQELDTYKLRLKLSIEETFELFEATCTEEHYNTVFKPILLGLNDAIALLRIEDMDVKPVKVLDSIVDQDVVNYGFANLLGLDLTPAWEEVHRSNMSKLGEDGQPVFREDGKVLKGPNYFEPDLESVYEKNKYIPKGEQLCLI